MPLVQDVVDTHPGLTFLKEAAEFHSRYVHTVSIEYEYTTLSIKTSLYRIPATFFNGLISQLYFSCLPFV